MHDFKTLSSALVLSSILLSGCGGSSSGSNTTTTSPPATTPTTPAPSENQGLEQAFPVSVSVFGIAVRATSDTATDKVLHAANVMAQYLDNNEDGLADNPQVVDRLVSEGATLIMAPTESQLETAATNLEQSDAYQALYGNETLPTPQSERFDATLEEVLHLITHVGYAKIYPDVFGEQTDSSIADAMDIARGGRFEAIPASYPESAWYTYDDQTCDYSCMVTEYTYWGLTSILGAQQNRLEEISHEWKLNTEEKVRLQDPAIYAILTNPEYGLATALPDGNYSAQTFEISGAPTTPTTSQSTLIGATSVASCRVAAQNDAPACFIIGDTQAEMNGVIGPNIVSKVNQLITDHPMVSSILLNNVPGSMDDVSNIEAAKIIYHAGLDTELSATSEIASGGVDFFLAGNNRIISEGAELGVHSWATEDEQGNVIQGKDIPEDHPNHALYIDYYHEIQHPNGREFYFYTLEAAPAEGIHIMSNEELVQWQMAR